MANNTFTGGSTNDGNLAVAANWSLGAFLASDNLIVNATNYDLYGDMTGTACASFQVTSGWKGANLGTTSVPVKIKTAGNVDLAGNPFLQQVNIGAGSANTIAKLRAQGMRSLVLNSGTITDAELDTIGSMIGAQDTSLINIRASRCPNMLLDVAGSAAGPLLMKLKQGSVLTTKRAAQAACDTRVDQSSIVVVNDPGSLGSAGTVELDGHLTYRSSINGPTVEVGPTGTLDENGLVKNLTYLAVRDWIGAQFDDRPTGVTVTVTTRTPVCKAT